MRKIQDVSKRFSHFFVKNKLNLHILTFMTVKRLVKFSFAEKKCIKNAIKVNIFVLKYFE